METLLTIVVTVAFTLAACGRLGSKVRRGVLRSTVWTPPPPLPPPAVPPPLDFGALPAPGQGKDQCPVCGWNPCSDDCSIGFSRYDIERLDAEFDEHRWDGGCGGGCDQCPE